MALECVNPEFNHYFIVDSPKKTKPKSKKKRKLFHFIYSLLSSGGS